MSIQIVKIDPSNPDKTIISQAARLLKEGMLVAFPTETVYGLGADALNEKAIRKIFEAKGRPTDNPIIIHVGDTEQLNILTNNVSIEAGYLIEKFWPGPLTIILPKSSGVPFIVTGGLDTVAVRMPKNEVALALLRSFGGPIAAPSANLSGGPSGTSATHVLHDFEGKIDMILDAGSVEVGIESTVLDISTDIPCILRPGAVTREQLEQSIGKTVATSQANILHRSPGTRYRHYSPKARVIVAQQQHEIIEHLIEKHDRAKSKIGLITSEAAYYNDGRIVVRAMPQDIEGYAQQIFAALRELDEQGVDLIIVEEVDEVGIGVAIMDRLRRAASS